FEQFRIGIFTEQIPSRAAVCIRSLQCDDWVSKNEEIRTAADAINGIRCAAVPIVEMRGRGGGQMSAGRESHYADPIRRDAELLRASSNQTNRALRVLKLNRMVILWSEPVFENKCRDAKRIQPICDLASFVVRRKMRVRAARRNNHRR